MEQIQRYCEEESIDPEELESVFQYACACSRFDIVELIIGTGKIDIQRNGRFALGMACNSGEIETVKFLLFLDIKGVLEKYGGDNPFVLAASLDITKLLFNYCKEHEINLGPEITNRAFRWACINGRRNTMHFLIDKFGEIDQKTWDESLIGACSSGKIEPLKFLFELAANSNIKFDLNKNNFPFRVACTSDSREVVLFLIEFADENGIEIDVTAEGNYAFTFACWNGNTWIVKVLIDYIKKHNIDFDLAYGNCHAFRGACANGHLDVVQFLLFSTSNDSSFENEENDESFEVGKIDICAEDNYALRWSCANGSWHVTQFLAEFAKKNGIEMDITVKQNHAFRWSCRTGYIESVEFVLDYAAKHGYKINIHDKDDYAFRYASTERHEAILDLLLSMLNTKRHKFYFHKDGQFYIVKPLDCEMNLAFTEFDDFRVYHQEKDYLDDCLDAFKWYIQRSRLKAPIFTYL